MGEEGGWGSGNGGIVRDRWERRGGGGLVTEALSGDKSENRTG